MLQSKFLHTASIQFPQNTHDPCLLPSSRWPIHQQMWKVTALNLGNYTALHIGCQKFITIAYKFFQPAGLLFVVVQLAEGSGSVFINPQTHGGRNNSSLIL